ncbi:hypothetical protein PIB30_031356 [Stylosanthes scabra]|uniref:Replication factor A C-terminal domain-containing protein n=1 Tax=Stylosanthes scabra TaxID=79078 RepID=A0ABU6VA55_9FABA|nr:hypothetical protein [Stylosanthes scabra]
MTDIDTKLGWWYKGCKECFQGLETLSDQFYCAKCDEYYNHFHARYCLRLRVADASGNASFVIFESACSSFLGISANELVTNLTMSMMTAWPYGWNELIQSVIIANPTDPEYIPDHYRTHFPEDNLSNALNVYVLSHSHINITGGFNLSSYTLIPP